jgi:hypothetical protein
MIRAKETSNIVAVPYSANPASEEYLSRPNNANVANNLSNN